ncbi:hypothetical protein C8J57DRAFT_1476030, partial [Mycena rebaudengoi]
MCTHVGCSNGGNAHISPALVEVAFASAATTHFTQIAPPRVRKRTHIAPQFRPRGLARRSWCPGGAGREAAKTCVASDDETKGFSLTTSTTGEDRTKGFRFDRRLKSAHTSPNCTRCMLPHPTVLVGYSGGVVIVERDIATSPSFVPLKVEDQMVGRLGQACSFTQSLGHDCTEHHHAETCRCLVCCVRCWSTCRCRRWAHGSMGRCAFVVDWSRNGVRRRVDGHDSL